jgi:hypothetical protein
MKLDKKLLPEYSTQSVKVYSIPQTQIIRHVGIKFTGGGHSRVYPEIPDGEIWIARELFATMEGKYYVLHEWHEYNKMGLGLSYDDAHVLSNRIEGKARKDHDAQLDELIKKEIIKCGDAPSERSHFNGTLSLYQDNKLHHLHHKKIHRNEHRRNVNALTVSR